MPLENYDFPQEVEWVIEPEALANVAYKEGTILFTFLNCKFKKLIIKNKTEILFEDVSIYFNTCYIESIVIEEIAGKNISVDFGSSLLSGQIKSPNIRAVGFNNCIIRDNFFLMDIPNISITYTEENIFVRRWLKLIRSLNTDYLSLLKSFQAFYIHLPQCFYFKINEKSGAKRGFYLDKYPPNSELKYSFTDEEKHKIYINLHLYFKEGKKPVNISILDSYLRSLSLNYSFEGNLNVENTRIDSLFISDMDSSGTANLYKISPLTNNTKDLNLAFHKSNLESFTFERVSFKSYGEVSFYRTSFEKARFIACDFPQKSLDFEKFKSLANVNYPHLLPENYYKDQYEIFIQLKAILEKSGNFYEAQKLNAIANESLRKTNDVDWADKQILLINSWSNYHGLSIVKPLKWFLLCSVVFYVAYLFSLNRIFNRNEIDWSLVGYYFSFIDITHRTDFLVDKKDFNAVMLLVDFLNKIFTGFFIYQFVAAFRKYGKK